ncbi:ABC transporter permease [Ohtaekwangia koreensis]|uniref:ABC-2 type transport system permease protein n=1 Tax=Ohtaekwangia koreensis TaxID=688867 RepID=A0A1T5LN36_9BACT|nr:ABC transporter permease [Ohtaekwangia koreensis]SKC77334.1 ABC-2 type transport system permease protein [Ohtaekwangia koreensis]
MKTLATIYKEFLLLIRDPGGLALIFIMPLALVIVMALVQDAPFRDYQEVKLDVLFVDQDADSLSAKVKQAFDSSPNVNLVVKTDTAEVKKLIQAGAFKAAIVIPANSSETLREKTKQLIIEVFSNFGLAEASKDSVDMNAIGIKILFDPAIKSNYKQTLTGGVQKIIAGIQAQWILDELQNQLSEGRADVKKTKVSLTDIIQVKEQYASEKKYQGLMLNSVQHNVPAWTMFAMFFILYPLAGNFIKEREEGSLLRLRLISGSQFPVISGKFAFYFMICLLQFVLMIAVGIYIMPLLGLSKLVLGSNIAGILLIACSVAMAATGYGVLIAVYFRTPQQALSFGSVSVVILSAIGGVWVPVYVMPEILQTISRFSPMSWGLESFNDLFLRQASIQTILPNVLRLTGFSLVTLFISVIIHKSRTIL